MTTSRDLIFAPVPVQVLLTMGLYALLPAIVRIKAASVNAASGAGH